MTDVNTKIFYIFIRKKMFFERTYYASFNDLKSRSKKPHSTVRNLCRKERGFSMLTKSEASAYIITLTPSFVLSNLVFLLKC